ncbi:hypothetical protein C2E23DRAFT_421620 [Lenzites betulinus]|nr:hypothetical protein C2E23DRAFT_421620 [Lenzites betulinus]
MHLLCPMRSRLSLNCPHSMHSLLFSPVQAGRPRYYTQLRTYIVSWALADVHPTQLCVVPRRLVPPPLCDEIESSQTASTCAPVPTTAYDLAVQHTESPAAPLQTPRPSLKNPVAAFQGNTAFHRAQAPAHSTPSYGRDSQSATLTSHSTLCNPERRQHVHCSCEPPQYAFHAL